MKITTHIDNRYTGRRNKPECKNYWNENDLLSAKAKGKNAHGQIERAVNSREIAPDKAMSEAAKNSISSISYARKLERQNKRRK